jgi:arsenate reductase
MPVTIYHNPNCSTSRNVLKALRDHGHEPQVIEYLKTPPSRAKLQELLAAMGFSVRDILRRNGTPFEELGLDNAALTDDELFRAIEKHPILIQRPIVVTKKGTRLCRPMEKVNELLDAPVV